MKSRKVPSGGLITFRTMTSGERILRVVHCPLGGEQSRRGQVRVEISEKRRVGLGRRKV